MQLVLMNSNSSNPHADHPISAGAAAAAAAQAAANLKINHVNDTSESANANDLQNTTTSTPTSDYPVDQDTAATAATAMTKNNSITMDSSTSAKNSTKNGTGKAPTTPYLYKDYSNVTDLESIEGYNSDDNKNKSNPTHDVAATHPPGAAIHDAHTMRLQKFPAKLESILSRPEWSGIVTWMPHGRSWKVSFICHSHMHAKIPACVIYCFFGVIS